MPRRTKEAEQLEEKVETAKKVAKTVEKKTTKKASSSTKKAATKTNTTTKDSTTKKASTKAIAKKSTSTAKKTTAKSAAKKSTTASKKATTKTSTATTKNKSTTKKAATSTKKATVKTTKKTTSSSKKATKTTKVTFSPEYYDLPYRYNQTIVKILAQTPKTLFVYWDISDTDRENLKKQYGEYIFEITKPVLIVYNDTLKYSFEIDINDFANSWYIHVNDSNCDYRIEVGRRPIPINYNYIPNYNNKEIKPIETSYIYITSSNEIKSPNNRILFNIDSNIYFRNVKTNEVIAKDISNFLFISNIGRFYNIFDLYKQFYKDEELLTKEFDLRNSSSSGNPSSGSLSSRF